MNYRQINQFPAKWKFFYYIYFNELIKIGLETGDHMKINKKKMLINYRKDHSNQYVSSQELTDFLHVSSRQLRNYITDINNGLSDLLILSAKQGYKLNNESENFPALLKRSLTDEESPDRRKEIILQKLISSTKGYDIFRSCR